MTKQSLQLVYTILCDDVRLEVGNKISLMGIFQNIMVERLPVSIIKFAVVNHWQGQGRHTTEVRILTPDKNKLVVSSQPTEIELSLGGFTDNVSFFVNVVFPVAGVYWIQTLANSVIVEEKPLIITDVHSLSNQLEEASQAVN
ncbi:MAG: hypothetical protein N2Z23_04025 [Pyrinomonadaceae bacterium]|nr:hypothetical protein [Pyrinomonadaceae bacterium]MCX7639596.1 hypothetical protein [Pyrinomonadaceae bacterium]MDW8303989.1 hypothetical protein [Acidobacteriota bacterium]